MVLRKTLSTTLECYRYGDPSLPQAQPQVSWRNLDPLEALSWSSASLPQDLCLKIFYLHWWPWYCWALNIFNFWAWSAFFYNPLFHFALPLWVAHIRWIAGFGLGSQFKYRVCLWAHIKCHSCGICVLFHGCRRTRISRIFKKSWKVFHGDSYFQFGATHWSQLVGEGLHALGFWSEYRNQPRLPLQFAYLGKFSRF